MRLAQIADCTGIGIRRLRYVVDHDLVPALPAGGGGRGRSRDFTPFQAFTVAAAAQLLEAGISRPMVCRILLDLGGADKSRGRKSLWRVWNLDAKQPKHYLRANEAVSFWFEFGKLRDQIKESVDGEGAA